MILLKLLRDHFNPDILLTSAADVNAGYGGYLLQLRDDLLIYIVIKIICFIIVYRQIHRRLVINVELHDSRSLHIIRQAALHGIRLFL